MDPTSHEGGAQKRTHAKNVVNEVDPFTSFLRTKVVFPEETELMIHEYEQQVLLHLTTMLIHPPISL